MFVGRTHSISRSRLSQSEDQLAELPQPCQLAADAGGSARQGVANVSSSSALVPHESKETAASSPAVANPLRNPSYPQRTHFGERPQLEETLSSWEQKLSIVTGKLTALAIIPAARPTSGFFSRCRALATRWPKPCAGCLWRPAPSTRKTANGSRPPPRRLGACFRVGMASKSKVAESPVQAIEYSTTDGGLRWRSVSVCGDRACRYPEVAEHQPSRRSRGGEDTGWASRASASSRALH